MSFISVSAERRACDSSPCQNGATCVNSGDRYTCSCPDGWDGMNCENNINDCTPHPCYNGGTCMDGVNWRICKCSPGFTGSDCRVNMNECASSPCAFGATCIDGIADFKCVCPPERTGKRCENVKGDLGFDKSNSQSCEWGGEIRPHGSVWRQHCNTCHCNQGIASCSSVWCGPENCMLNRGLSTYPCQNRGQVNSKSFM